MSTEVAADWSAWSKYLHAHFPTAGRNDLPTIVFDAFYGGKITSTKMLSQAIEAAWTAAEFPRLLVEDECWVEMFETAGFIERTAPGAVPATIPTLYRAAAVGHEQGMSWTDSLEQAKYFYDRNTIWGFDTVLMRLTEVAPYDVLAHFPSSRNEAEWVLHPLASTDAEKIRQHTKKKAPEAVAAAGGENRTI